MKKVIITMILTCIMLAASATVVLAAGWEHDGKGWKWKNDNGTYAASTWQWCDGNKDGISECYYFTNLGYCVQNATVENAYYVNKDGAWAINNVVQLRKGVGPGGADKSLSEKANIANTTLESYASTLTYTGVDGTEKYKMSVNGDDITFDVTIAKTAAEITPAETKKLYWSDEHYKVMQLMANAAMGFFGSSKSVTENVYSSDGVLLFSYTYHGSPYGV